MLAQLEKVVVFNYKLPGLDLRLQYSIDTWPGPGTSTQVPGYIDSIAVLKVTRTWPGTTDS